MLGTTNYTPEKEDWIYIHVFISLYETNYLSHQSWRLLLLGLSDSGDKLNESTFLSNISCF